MYKMKGTLSALPPKQPLRNHPRSQEKQQQKLEPICNIKIAKIINEIKQNKFKINQNNVI